MTPKIHVICKHVREFCLQTKRGLSFWGEQAVESVHHDFEEFWKNFKVLKSHENYDAKILRCVCAYNSSHL